MVWHPAEKACKYLRSNLHQVPIEPLPHLQSILEAFALPVNPPPPKCGFQLPIMRFKQHKVLHIQSYNKYFLKLKFIIYGLLGISPCYWPMLQS